MTKLFFTLLAAAAVVIGYLRAQAQIDAWHTAISALLADNRRSAVPNLDDLTSRERVLLTSRDLADMADMSYHDVFRKTENNRGIIRLLDAKPFGLPLNADERALRTSCRKLVAQIEEEQRREESETRAARAAATSARATPPPKPGDWLWRHRSALDSRPRR